MEIIIIILCHFHTLKPIDFAWTYCFMIFAQILLKFCDIVSLWWISIEHQS
jgi:hypothetical protein